MNPINTFPIEQFLDKARIATKSNQKVLTLDIKEVQALYDSLASTMTRLAGLSSMNTTGSNTDSLFTIKMDGGGFN